MVRGGANDNGEKQNSRVKAEAKAYYGDIYYVNV
jgi:hypothetical protein